VPLRPLILLALYIILTTLFAVNTPVGEAPDEPAHFAYVQELATGSLPSSPPAFDRLNYEYHQPPLYYLTAAAASRLAGATDVELSFDYNDDFSFTRPGARAFRSAPPLQLVLPARVTTLLWGVLLAAASLGLTWRVTGQRSFTAGAFLLAPQLLFISGSINNDAAVAALSSLTLLILLNCIREKSASAAWWSASGFALALFAKGSALFLLAPLMIAFLLLIRRGALRIAFLLISAWAAAVAVWVGFGWIRFGHLTPPVPHGSPGDLVRLMTDPGWVGSLFVSFWAKLGWLNTPLPLGWYGWFALQSIIVLAGAAALFRRRQDRDEIWILSAAIGGNIALIVGYMLLRDWQPQGRYLFPSIGIITLFGVNGWSLILQRMNVAAARVTEITILCIAVAAALLAVFEMNRLTL
jgi:4-amino-4-deoxy-L-arabinose transferase-like glycosyltransferase